MSTPPVTALAHRDGELAAIDAAWADLAEGRPSVLVVSGSRGVGKSALLDAALRRLPADAVVLRARCTAAEQAFPLSVVGQLFDPVGSDQPHGDGPPTQDLLQGFFRTTRSMAAKAPVVLAIDDLHLADVQSLQWFSYITRRLDGLPVGVIVTVLREAADLLGDLDPPPGTRTLLPAPLCDSCTAYVAGELMGGPLDPELAVASHVLSQGNPLVLTELARRWRSAGVDPGSPDVAEVLAIGSATVADTTLEWLYRSDPAAIDLLAAIALLGPTVEPSVAAILAGQGDFVAAGARDTLVQAGLVEADPPDRLSHELLRSAALARITPADRLGMHAHAAELLTRLGAPPAQAAEHLLLVGSADREGALPVLRTAARDAAAAGAWDDAVRYLRRALAESRDSAVTAAVTAELGSVELQHDLPAAARYAETLADGPGAPVERAQAVLPLARPVLAVDGGAATRALAGLATALAATPDAPPPLLLRYGGLALLSGHRTGVRRWLRAVPSRPTGDRLDLDAGELRSSLAAFMAASGRHRARTVSLARHSAGGHDPGAAAIGAVLALTWAEELDEAEAAATWLVDTARADRHRADEALALAARADIGLRRGRLPVALADAQDAARLAHATHAGGLHAVSAALAAVVLVECGQPERAAAALDRVALPADPHPLVRGRMLHATAVVATATGDAAQGVRLGLEAGHQLASRGIANPACVPWRAAVVTAYIALGERSAALSVAQEEHTYAARWGTPGLVGQALGLVSLVTDDEERAGTARRAVELLIAGGQTLALARAYGYLAAAETAAGNPSAAEDASRSSVALATQCGAAGLVGSVAGTPRRTLLGSAGGRPIRLTTSESRVTDLVLRGMSNQEVADALCISRRTVDTHLNRVYRKLSIRSRAELPDALSRLD